MTTAPDITIHIASQGDIDAIAAIYALTFDAMQPRLAVEQYLRPEGTWALLATIESDGKERPAGFVLARTVLDETEIFSFGVAPANQRQGVGESMMATTQQIAGMKGAKNIFLEVGIDNPKARALYGKCGYEVVGRRPDYYRKSGGERVAALILRLDLGIQGANNV